MVFVSLAHYCGTHKQHTTRDSHVCLCVCVWLLRSAPKLTEFTFSLDGNACVTPMHDVVMAVAHMRPRLRLWWRSCSCLLLLLWWMFRNKLCFVSIHEYFGRKTACGMHILCIISCSIICGSVKLRISCGVIKRKRDMHTLDHCPAAHAKHVHLMWCTWPIKPTSHNRRTAGSGKYRACQENTTGDR